MKKYKPFSLFLEYIYDYYGPTLTERNLYDLDYRYLAITHLQFRYHGAFYKIPFVLDWDWTRKEDGFYVYFSHPSPDPSLDKLIEDELKERIFKFGKLHEGIYIYFNNNKL